MVSLVLATPATLPPIDQPAVNPSIEMSWTSWDGTSWDLVSGRQGVALQKGVRGLNMPPITRYAQSSAGVHGSRRTGWVAREREVFWPTLIYKPTGDPTWSELDSLFWRSMHPDRPGIWRVRGAGEGAEPRTLSCIYANDGGHALNHIPSVRGWETYGLYLAAEKPFWMGPTVRRSFGSGSQVGFFGDVLTISSGSTVSKATVSNPGDLEAWPEWTIVGPVASGTLGLNGRQIRAPFAIPAGKALRVNTDPTVQTILYGDWVIGPDGEGRLVNPVDRFMQMGDIQFAPIPAGSDVPLQLTLQEPGEGAGVQMSLTPRYFRAW